MTKLVVVVLLTVETPEVPLPEVRKEVQESMATALNLRNAMQRFNLTNGARTLTDYSILQPAIQE